MTISSIIPRFIGGVVSWVLTPPGWSVLVCRNQAEVDRDVPAWLELPAAVRVLLLSPLEGLADVQTHLARRRYQHLYYEPGLIIAEDKVGKPLIHGLIVGGGERPCHPAWVRALRDQAREAAVCFAFLGWGTWLPTAQMTDSQRYDDEPGYINLAGKRVAFIDKKSGRVVRGAGVYEYGCPYNYGPREAEVVRVGAARSGRLLDGALHDQLPEGVPT